MLTARIFNSDLSNWAAMGGQFSVAKYNLKTVKNISAFVDTLNCPYIDGYDHYIGP